jgi:hypothetical protein
LRFAIREGGHTVGAGTMRRLFSKIIGFGALQAVEVGRVLDAPGASWDWAREEIMSKPNSDAAKAARGTAKV